MHVIADENNVQNYQDKIREWFDQAIQDINVDRMMMETGTAPETKRQRYEDRMYGRLENVYLDSRKTSSIYFLENLLKDYLTFLKEFNAYPLELALNLSDAKILVWANIKEDDEHAEDALLLSEAKANEKYSRQGFFISTTIVEDSDNLRTPPHYHKINLK